MPAPIAITRKEKRTLLCDCNLPPKGFKRQWIQWNFGDAVWSLRVWNPDDRDRLSKCLTFAKGGEEVVIRDRNLPVAKLVPFSAEGADDQELVLVAAGKLHLPQVRLNVKELLKIPPGSVSGNKAIQAVLAGREDDL